MNLDEEIKKNLIFNLYNKIFRLTKYIKTFKWIAGILFTLGAFDILLFDKIHDVILFLFLLIWIPGLSYVFVGGILHFLAGRKINSLSKKYNIDKSDLIQKL